MYTDKVMDHFTNPRNVGEIEDASGVGEVGNASCGDIMKIFLKVEDNVIKEVKFKTFGCGAAIATSSMVTEMAIGKTIEEILQTATSFEETARNFYRDLAPKVSKRIRWLVDELADPGESVAVALDLAEDLPPARFDRDALGQILDNLLDNAERHPRGREDRTVEIVVSAADDAILLRVTDNGPGILKSQIPRIFGKLLYGSKFHRLRMSRGQQGIGISAAGMYGMLTTGKPLRN